MGILSELRSCTHPHLSAVRGRGDGWSSDQPQGLRGITQVPKTFPVSSSCSAQCSSLARTGTQTTDPYVVWLLSHNPTSNQKPPRAWKPYLGPCPGNLWSLLNMDTSFSVGGDSAFV